jgi:mersacidin/lichenicidin family type 2 lantibiotic
MKTEMIVRAWKDPRYRASLSAEQRAALPDFPSGKPITELEESELGLATGGLMPVRGNTGCGDGATCGIF